MLELLEEEGDGVEMALIKAKANRVDSSVLR